MGLGLQGAYGVEAMQQAVRQRIADQLAEQVRQQQLTQQARENAQRERQLSMQETAAASLQQDRADRLKETTRNNQVSGALRIVPLLKPGQMVSDADAANITEAGMGSLVKQQPRQLPSVSMNGISGPDPTKGGVITTEQIPEQPAGYEFTGTQADEVRAEERAFRAAEAERTRIAATERANADREMRGEIARMGAGNSAETRALANQLKEVQIKAAEEKLTTATTARSQQMDSARAATKAALDSIDALMGHPGLDAATGAYDVRGLMGGLTQPVVDFNAERDKLVAALTLPNLGALKGPMSDKDILFVKQLATKLSNARLSKPATVQELQRAKLLLQSTMETDRGAAPLTTIRFVRDASGKLVREGK